MKNKFLKESIIKLLAWYYFLFKILSERLYEIIEKEFVMKYDNNKNIIFNHKL